VRRTSSNTHQNQEKNIFLFQIKGSIKTCLPYQANKRDSSVRMNGIDEAGALIPPWWDGRIMSLGSLAQ